MAADPEKLKKLAEIRPGGINFTVVRRPGNQRLYFGSSDFGVYEVDMAAEKPEPQAFAGDGHQSYVTGMALTAGGLVSGSYDGRLIWWDPESRKQVRAVEAHDRWIREVATTPDGRIVASVADDMVGKLWDADSGKLLHTLADHQPETPHHYPSMLYAVAVSPDGRLVATGDRIGHVAVWEVATGEKVGEVEAPVMYTWDPRARRHSIGGIRSLQFSPDMKTLAVGGMGKVGNIDHLGGKPRVELFDWKAGQRLHEIEVEKFEGLVEQIAFHESGAWFLTAGGKHKGFLVFLETESGEVMHKEKAPGHIHEFATDESFETVYTAGHDRIITWQLKGADDPAVAARPA